MHTLIGQPIPEKVLNRYRLNREITANTQARDDSNLRPTDSNNRSMEVIKMEMR